MGKLREEFLFMEVHSYSWTWHSFAYAFSTWVIYLSSSPVDSMSLLTSFEFSKNTPIVTCIRGLVLFLCQYCQVTPCPCSREIWSSICSQFTFYHVGHLWVNFVHHSVVQFTPKHIWSCFMSMMGDSSWPSFDESILVEFNSLSRN